MHNTHATTKSYRVTERDHRFDQQPWGGYSRHNLIVREVLHDDQVVDEQLLAVNDALVMYSPLLEDGSQPAAD